MNKCFYLRPTTSYQNVIHTACPPSSNQWLIPAVLAKIKSLIFVSNFNQSLLSFFSLNTQGSHPNRQIFSHTLNILSFFIMLSDLHSIKQHSNGLLSNERSDMSVWSLPGYFKVLLFLIKKHLCFHLVHLVELQELKWEQSHLLRGGIHII